MVIFGLGTPGIKGRFAAYFYFYFYFYFLLHVPFSFLCSIVLLDCDLHWERRHIWWFFFSVGVAGSGRRVLIFLLVNTYYHTYNKSAYHII